MLVKIEQNLKNNASPTYTRIDQFFDITRLPSIHRARDLGRSNKFGQMQELSNDEYYIDMMLYCIFHNAHGDIKLLINKKKH